MGSSKAGYLAKVEISSGNQVLGASSYTYTGESVDMHESTHFNTSGYKIDTPLMIAGGEITVTGDFRLNDVTGQEAIKAAFKARTELRDFRLYIDASSYYVPDASLFSLEDTTGSYVTITKSPTNVSFDTAGVGTMEFTAKVTGALILVDATQSVVVQTLGRIHDDQISDAVFIGRLLSMGNPTLNSCMDLKFRYGTNKNVLNSETSVFSGSSDLDMFGIWQSDILLSAGATSVLFYQAVATGNQDNSQVGTGAILSDTFYSDILGQE